MNLCRVKRAFQRMQQLQSTQTLMPVDDPRIMRGGLVVTVKTESVPLFFSRRQSIVESFSEAVPGIFPQALHVGLLVLERGNHGGNHLQGFPDVPGLSDSIPVFEQDGVTCPGLCAFQRKEQHQPGSKIKHAGRGYFIQSRTRINEDAVGRMLLVELAQQDAQTLGPGDAFFSVHAVHPGAAHLGI